MLVDNLLTSVNRGKSSHTNTDTRAPAMSGGPCLIFSSTRYPVARPSNENGQERLDVLVAHFAIRFKRKRKIKNNSV